MRIYLSGPITGKENGNAAEFERVEQRLKLQGFRVFNPHTIGVRKSWVDYMRADIKKLMDCDSIYMLKGWEQSHGAKLEKMIAESLGYKIFFDEVEL